VWAAGILYWTEKIIKIYIKGKLSFCTSESKAYLQTIKCRRNNPCFHERLVCCPCYKKGEFKIDKSRLNAKGVIAACYYLFVIPFQGLYQLIALDRNIRQEKRHQTVKHHATSGVYS